MSFDTYQAELKIIEHGEAVMAEADKADLPTEYKDLLKNYVKLLKTTNRLVRMSDRSEERLKEANVKIQHQQGELEKAHLRLSEHAQNLEEKVKERTKELLAAQDKLEGLVRMGIALSMERQHARFMEMIVQGQKELTNADGGILYSLTDQGLAYEIVRFDTLELRLGGLSGRNAPVDVIPLRDEEGRPRYFNPMAHALLTERTVNVPNVYECPDFDFSDVFEFDRRHGYRSQSFLAVPLKPRKGEVLGVLVLINARVLGTGRTIGFGEDAERFIEALASQAAVAQDNQNLMEAQTKLLDAIIQVLAGAIDTKSPYTGGHCARVPQLGSMLAKAACEAEDGPFADFDMSEAEWREFQLAGWLHDCGKVTTPEYVVDKATKLETIYNRIHEVRMRFEVLLRDRRIEYLEALQGGKGDPETLKQELEAAEQALQDDFAFVAESNVGGEFMSPERIERLERIARTTWKRNFDDRLGLSQAELLRLDRIPPATLPAEEKLLADKKEHVIRRPKGEGLPYDPKALGINVVAPRHMYNLGELHNLRVARGTLTPEEFYKIKEHVIVTLTMLEQLPFPKQLSRVPQIAASHHETMAGTGYPRGLDGEALPVQARVLAIADIFEALTASDRPYKKAKTLSEALRIMSFMRNDRHIDAELFDLFLTSGVYRSFAEKHLLPEQMEEVDVTRFLSAPPPREPEPPVDAPAGK